MDAAATSNKLRWSQ